MCEYLLDTQMYFEMNADIPHKWRLETGVIHQLQNSELLQVEDSLQIDPGIAHL